MSVITRVRHLKGRQLLVFMSCFYIQFLTYGFCSSFGIFYSEFSQNYEAGKGQTAWVGSIAASLVLLIGPVATYLINRFGYRLVCVIGALVSSSGLVACIYSPNVYVMYVTYGAMTGIGNGFMNAASIMAITEYFPTIVATATATIMAGASVGLSVYPIIVQILLDEYDFHSSFWVHAGLFLQVIVPAMLLKPTKIRKHNKVSFINNFSVLRNHGLKLQLGVAMINYFSYNVVLFYLPDYSTSLRISPTNAAFLVSVHGITGIFSRIICGLVSDKIGRNVLFLYGILPLVESVVVLCMPYVDIYWLLLITSILNGLLGSPFTSMIISVLKELVGFQDVASAYGFWLFSAGVGVLVGPPVAGWFTDLTGSYISAFYLSSAMFFISGILLLISAITVKIKRRGNKTTNKVLDRELIYVISENRINEKMQFSDGSINDLCVVNFPS